MYKNIAVPVDLNHVGMLEKVLATAADLARHYEASTTLVAVTNPAPTEIAHNPAEFESKLNEFAAKQSQVCNILFKTKVVTSNDPAIDMEKKLDTAIHELGADLVVMASHVPGFRDYIFRSHTGYLASHTDLSVFIVR